MTPASKSFEHSDLAYRLELLARFTALFTNLRQAQMGSESRHLFTAAWGLFGEVFPDVLNQVATPAATVE